MTTISHDYTGDYQFDVYRLMRKYNGDDWETFKPLTNVMVSFVLETLIHQFIMKTIVATLSRTEVTQV